LGDEPEEKIVFATKYSQILRTALQGCEVDNYAAYRIFKPKKSVNMTKETAQICGIYDGFWARIS